MKKNTYKIKLREYTQEDLKKSTPITFYIKVDTQKIGRYIIIPDVLKIKKGVLVEACIKTVVQKQKSF